MMNSQRPNIVLIVSDDHGREALGCYGNDVVKTPNLDKLAEEGVRFTNSFCTTASCAASRSVILTGKHNHANGTYGHTHGFHHFSCFDGVKTLPAYLNEGGYRTGGIGKQHYAPMNLFPFNWHPGITEYFHDDIKMANACDEFFKEDSEKPFFFYFCSVNPHRAQVVENHSLKPNSFGNPAENFDGDEEKIYKEEDVIIPSFLSDTPAVRAELAQYYQSISRLDRGVGRLIELLKENNVYDNTVIMYISDNGAAFPEAKTTLYDPGMNLPLIVRSPQHNQNVDCDGLVTWADLAPTILDFAEIDYQSDDFHGASFKDILNDNENCEWREEIYASHTFHEISNYYPMRVIRTKKFKFIYNIAYKLDYSFASDLWDSASWQHVIKERLEEFGSRSVDAYIHRAKFELYNLENDPDEVENLVEKREYKELVEGFCQKLQLFQKETNDPWLHKWEYE